MVCCLNYELGVYDAIEDGISASYVDIQSSWMESDTCTKFVDGISASYVDVQSVSHVDLHLTYPAYVDV